MILAGVQFALVGASVFGAVWSQQVLGFGPIRAGVAMLPLTLPLLVVAPLGGRLYDRIGPRPLLVTGSLLIAAGLAWLAWRLPLQDYGWLIPGYAVMGAGIGHDDLARHHGRARRRGAARAQPGERHRPDRPPGRRRDRHRRARRDRRERRPPSPRARAAEARVTAATDGVAAAYWTGAGVMALMALVAFRFVHRRIRPLTQSQRLDCARDRGSPVRDLRSTGVADRRARR